MSRSAEIDNLARSLAERICDSEDPVAVASDLVDLIRLVTARPKLAPAPVLPCDGSCCGGDGPYDVEHTWDGPVPSASVFGPVRYGLVVQESLPVRPSLYPVPPPDSI